MAISSSIKGSSGIIQYKHLGGAVNHVPSVKKLLVSFQASFFFFFFLSHGFQTDFKLAYCATKDYLELLILISTFRLLGLQVSATMTAFM